MSDTCGGACCAVFWLSEPPKPVEAYVPGSDGAKIADMVIPLTRRQALRRWRKYVSTELPLVRSKNQGTYTCRHWDTKTRLCGNYDDRPDLCRNYPYGQPCSHGCSYQIEDRSIAERYGNGTWKWDEEAHGWRPQNNAWFLWDAEKGVLKPVPTEVPPEASS